MFNLHKHMQPHCQINQLVIKKALMKERNFKEESKMQTFLRKETL